jgi:hypothetical protein
MPTPDKTPDTAPNCADETPEIAPADIDALMEVPARRPPGTWVTNDGDRDAPPEAPDT